MVIEQIEQDEQIDLAFAETRREEPVPSFFYCPCLEDVDAEVFPDFVCTGHGEGFVRVEFGDQVIRR